MDYADVTASFADPQPSPAPVPLPTVDASPARRFRDAIEPLAMHAVWSKTTNDRLAALGLNFLTGYVWGRAAALGEPDAAVVASSFAVFDPGLVTTAYADGRRAVARGEMLAARSASTITSLNVLLEAEEVTATAESLRAAVIAVSGMGRPLFSGLRSEPWPTEPVGVLWRACELAREHRGDGHVAVCLAEGLGPIEMNILTELFVGFPLGTYSASRGWSAEQLADATDDLRSAGLVEDEQLTPAGLVYRREIEARTDALDQPVLDAIGDLDSLLIRLSEWSQRCVDAGSFPPDPLKRAAG